MADEAQRFCLGIAYMPGPDPRIAKGADGGRDWISEAELEKAAWSYLRNGPQVNAFHVAGTEGCATTVESSIHRGPDWDLGDGIVVRKGTWLVGAILDDRMWQAALDGKVNGWSPEGIARRRRVAKEGAVPIAKSASPAEGDEEFSELTDCDFPTLGLVGKGANGIPRFLVMKNAEGEASGLLDGEFVRELIGKQADPEPDERGRAVLPSGITVSGSPADIAAFIHKAAQRAETGDVAKAEMSSKSVNDLDDDQFAYIEPGGKKDESGKTTPRSKRHFPINDAAHVRNALARASSRPFGDKAMGKIRSAAKKFGIEVSKEAGVAEPVTKAGDMGPELDGGVDGMDPTVPLAEPDDMAPGDMTDPGSPAWESIDAATARKWTSIAVRLKNALCVMAEREMLEAAGADPGDAENAFDLEDAMCAVDYVIGTLAGFAVDEQAEADLGGEAMEAIGKAFAGPVAADLDTVEGLCAVAKSGRVLSSVNEAHIREAAARLNTVLSSLPAAPTAGDGQPVAKMTPAEEAGMPEAKPSEDVTAASGQQPAMGTAEPPVTAQEAVVAKAADGPQEAAEPVRKSSLALVYDQDRRVVGVTAAEAIVQQVAKADGDGEKKAMQAVFDQDGDLIGIVDPDAIQPVTGAGGKAPAGDSADAAPAADDGDMTPQPPADAGTPADAVDDDGTVAKSSDNDVYAALESAVTKAVAAALDSRTPAGDVAKQADVAGLLEVVETLKARLETVENTPAAPKVFTNGQVPPAHQMRGQDQGAASTEVDIAKARARKAELYAADGPGQARIAKEMQQDAVDVLTAMHAARR